MYLEAQVEVAKAGGASSGRPGAPCSPNLLVMRATLSVFVGDSSSTVPRGHYPRQPKGIYGHHKLGSLPSKRNTIHQEGGTLQEKKGEWGTRGGGQDKVAGGQPHSG